MAFEGSTMGAAEVRTFAGGIITEQFIVSLADVDMLQVELVGGRTYEIDVDNGNDSLLRIFDAFGNEVKRNDDGFDLGEATGLQPYTQFMANYSGRYYLAFSPYYLDDYNPAATLGRVSPENGLTVAVSDLTVTDLGARFFPDFASISGITAKGNGDQSDVFAAPDRRPIRIEYAVATSVTSGGDVEMGRFDLLKGETVVVDINGRITGSADILDAVVRVFDDTGSPIGIDNGSGSGEDSELIFVAPNTDDFYIAVSGEGNASYDALNGSGTLTGDGGLFTAILHRNPTLMGSSGAQVLNGTGGADYIVLLAGADTADGGLSNDTIAGGDDNDTLTGGDGEDTLYGEFDNDTLDGGRGRDVVVGGEGDDSLRGGTTTSDDRLEGGVGNDTLTDGNGNDTQLGGDGADTMNAGAGNNAADGGAGNDTLVAGPGADTLLGGTGNDSLNASDGANRLDGGAGADSIRGGAVADTLIGGSGNDTIIGLDGADTISGGDDADTLNGSLGNDTISGDPGNDSLLGGAGADVFDFNAIAEQTDIIGDFVPATDRIDLVGIFGAGVVNAGNLAQFVQVTVAGISDTFLGVDANGPGGGIFFNIIAQVNGLTPAQLFDINNFIL
jgi:Ca2+-binding RTX toxin-like protein